ncbi:MAG: winged helix-turn-helix transcriptional regulator, partial [Pseudomonadota bacterium]
SLKGIGTNLLAARLKRMEQDDLIECRSVESSYGTYHLTEFGLNLEPMILEFIRWGFGLKRGQKDYHHQHDWDLLALKAAFRPELSHPTEVITVGFTKPEFVWVSAGRGEFKFGFEDAHHCDVMVDSSMQRYHQAPDRVRIRGSKRKLATFGKAFKLTH